jgi:hypothetical protein
MNRVEKVFKSKAVIKGGIMLFPKDVAIQFIENCRTEGISILGIDGFYVTGDKIQPSQDDSIDFSIESLVDTHGKALNFINGRPNGVHFEIVCE